MKYRALLCGVPGKVRQEFSSSLLVLEEWAGKTFDKLSDAEREHAYVRFEKQTYENVKLVYGRVAPTVTE
jgi:hypothetical protein